jgi:DNA-binding LacI/PurR family transcriptional regulator
MSGSRKISLADVARKAHVSAQTVSRVANGAENVRERTKQHVLDAMEELGYRPNLAARALKQGSFKAIGIAMFDITATGNAQTIQGITKAANENGYALVLDAFDLERANAIEKVVEKMRTLPIDGILIGLERMVSDIDTFVPTDDLPVNLITSFPSKTMTTIDADQYECSQHIVDYLLEFGHKNVYFVSGPENSIANKFRLDGWKNALVARGITPPEVFYGDWGANSGFEAGRALAHVDGCTAVYAANDAMANGVIQGLLSEGKRVPTDVSVIGVDNSLTDFVPELTLTSMDLGTARVGYQAFTNLMNSIELGAPQELTHTLLPGRLIKRSSVAQPHD